MWTGVQLRIPREYVDMFVSWRQNENQQRGEQFVWRRAHDKIHLVWYIRLAKSIQQLESAVYSQSVSMVYMYMREII